MTAFFTNTVRSLATLMPWSFTNQRHNFEKDYGWPDEVGFNQLFRAAHRNGIARAAVDKTSLRVWNTLPEVWESEEPEESPLEFAIRKRFDDICFWQACIEADRRAYIGGYSALIFRFADNKRFRDPVDFVPGGLDGFVQAEPLWAFQLVVKDWEEDESSDNYGKPKMFQLQEGGGIETTKTSKTAPRRSFEVHPDRVIIWSRDRTVHARSDLEPGYDDLLDMQKIKGAGGEGFWKTAKGMPVIEVSPEARLQDLATMMSVPVDKIKEALDTEIADFQGGFNQSLILAGMKATAVNVVLPQPKEFFQGPLQSFAASVSMPTRILLGNETGERSSTEDQEDFNRVCMSRRAHYIVPILRDFLNRLKKFGVLLEKKEYAIGWDSLLDMSPDQKMQRAKAMADINKTVSDPMTGSHPIFIEDEIREEAGFQPLTTAQVRELEEGLGEADDAAAEGTDDDEVEDVE